MFDGFFFGYWSTPSFRPVLVVDQEFALIHSLYIFNVPRVFILLTHAVLIWSNTVHELLFCGRPLR